MLCPGKAHHSAKIDEEGRKDSRLLAVTAKVRIEGGEERS